MPPLRPQCGHRAMAVTGRTETRVPMSPDDLSRAVTCAVALSLALAASGCAGVGDSFLGGAFVDPAKYDNFDCKQLGAERKSLAVRTTELQRLVDKAQTGVGGVVVGEMVYRNDYVSVRASASQVEEMWQRNHCADAMPSAVR